MMKKSNFLFVLPLYGLFFFIFYLGFQWYKRMVDRRKFIIYTFSCGIVAGILMNIPMFWMVFNYQTHGAYKGFWAGFACLLIVSGYLANLFAYLLFRKMKSGFLIEPSHEPNTIEEQKQNF